MIELVAFENATILLWGFFILLLIIASCYVYSKLKFKHKANAIAAQIKTLSEYLDELFKPDKRIKQEDIDVFLEENKIAIDAAKEICLTPSIYKDLLKSTGIEAFNTRISNTNLQASLRENNTVYDAIEQLNNLCEEPINRFYALVAPDHYFSFSEMESFKRSLSEIESYEKQLFPKYSGFISNNAVKSLLNIKKDVEQIRLTHNKTFINNELAKNKLYFDTVLGKYPLDPQQRDSIVKLEDNCLVIASAGSGKTSTILGKAKYLVEKRGVDPSKILLITYTRKAANEKYKEGIDWKRITHERYRTTLIETTSADFRNGSVEAKLLMQLRRCGVPVKERTDQELYELLVKRNRKLEKSVYTLILSFITLMKANEKTIDRLMVDLQIDKNDRNENILTNIIKPFYEEYQSELNKSYEIDFTDAIIQATELCREGLWRDYDYILVDEFQDISIDRYEFLQALRSDEPKTKLYCVGDDWQSIFRFAGSDMSLFYEFEKYFGYTELCKIETTYRFHQPLIDRSSEFIMKNKEQKAKTIKTPNDDIYKTYLSFEKCESNDDGVLKKVGEIVGKIPASQSVIIIGRYNYDATSVGFSGKIDIKESKIRVNIAGREIPFLSVHSAKGLEADNVILINCNQGAYGFPSLIEDDPILDFVLSKRETYPFAEERRLFYVAMTRARMHMYVLFDQDKPSPFVGEFLLKVEKGSCLCPRCLEGKVMTVKEGTTTNGVKYRCFSCSNKEGGCDFFETKYGDITSPGIKITDKMTAQDVEKLREARRKAAKNRQNPMNSL